MRQLVDSKRLRSFMKALGRGTTSDGRVYLTGGATAVLLEWRSSTIDVDLKLEPERDDLLRAIPAIKEELQINVELASPGDFIPELPGWRERSPFIVREGHLFFHHYDFYAQALSKIERGHTHDLNDVQQMHALGLIRPDRLRELFESIKPQLYRYPAIDPGHFADAVEGILEGWVTEGDR
jgi:hypothetical protein